MRASSLVAVLISVTNAKASIQNSIIGLVGPTQVCYNKKGVNLIGTNQLQNTRIIPSDLLERNPFQTRYESLIVRGGSKQNEVEKDKPSTKNKIIIASLLSIVFAAIAMNYDSIRAFDFKGELSTRLDNLAALGTKGVILYTLAFCLWEVTVGVTTPVETAAGMAFGLKNGIIANAVGKTSGAFIAFLLGRYVLKDAVEKRLEGNELMDLVQDSIRKNPFRVSLIWRFSFLPEQAKNCGLAVLPVKAWQFIAAVLCHGFPFTLLWTFLGNEMGLIVRGVMDQPSRTLKILMSGVYVFGFFISPSMVGLWIKGLRDEKLKKESGSK